VRVGERAQARVAPAAAAWAAAEGSEAAATEVAKAATGTDWEVAGEGGWAEVGWAAEETATAAADRAAAGSVMAAVESGSTPRLSPA
jgi:hypothetical protein